MQEDSGRHARLQASGTREHTGHTRGRTSESCGLGAASYRANLNNKTDNDTRIPDMLLQIQPCQGSLETTARVPDNSSHKPNKLPCNCQIVIGTWMPRV